MPRTRVIEWPPGSGRSAEYDDAEFELLRSLQQRCERGEITQEQLGREIGHLHDAKVELEARVATSAPAVISRTGLKTPDRLHGAVSEPSLPIEVDPSVDLREAVEIPPVVWDAIAQRVDELTATIESRPTERVWTPSYRMVGLIGEWHFSRLLDERFELSKLYDGGRDFGDIDVKTVPYYAEPLLKRLSTDKFVASFYALCATDLDQRLVRYVGWATRNELRDAPESEYGYGPTRTLTEAALRGGLPPRGRL